MKDKGTASQILHLSDRIMVLYEGEIMGIIDREKESCDVEELGLMMCGALKRGEGDELN